MRGEPGNVGLYQKGATFLGGNHYGPKLAHLLTLEHQVLKALDSDFNLVQLIGIE